MTLSPVMDGPSPSGSLIYIYRWRIPRWSEIAPLVEHTSPLFDADGMRWLFKIYKGRRSQPQSLATYLGVHKAAPSKLRGIKKKVKIVFMLENQKTQVMEFGKEEYPVWFCEKHSTWGEEHLLRLDELDHYIKNDTIQLTVQFEILATVTDLPLTAQRPDPHPAAFLLRSPLLSDVTLHCASPEPPNQTRTYPAHRAILASHSPYFLTLFTNGMTETFANEVTLPDTDHRAFESLLAYCYTLVPPTFNTLDEAEGLLILADRLAVHPLRDHCLHHLRLHISTATVWHIWSLAERFVCSVTSSRARRFVASRFEALVLSDYFLRADEEVIEMALSLDEIKVTSEERIFEALMRWVRFDPGDEPARKRSKSLPLQPSRSKLTLVDDLLSTVTEDSESSTHIPATQPNILISRPTTPNNLQLTPSPLHRTAACSSPRSALAPSSNAERRRSLPRLLKKIRFPLMDKRFLVDVVERDLTALGRAAACGKDLLIEAYRYQLFRDSASATTPHQPPEVEDEDERSRMRPRREFVPVDGED